MRALANAALAALAMSGCVPPGAAATVPASSASPLGGRPAPDFSRADLEGRRFDLAAARGRVAIVKFVAKYCAPCVRTLPAIEALHRDHPELVVVAVSEDETEDDARALVRQYGLTFPVVHDGANALAGRYRVTDLPVTFIVDRAGTVAWVGGPEKSEDELVRAALAPR